MKKYLMIGFAAVAFAACSNHDFETMSQEDVTKTQDKAKYDAAFVKAFGTPSANQDWGFGASTRAFTRALSDMEAGANKNRNLWAATDGSFKLLVPTPLTAGQKLRVKAYFQQHRFLTWETPDMTDYFVQQVYTGSTNTEGSLSTEIYTSGNGASVPSGENMNKLSVTGENIHVLDFNAANNVNTATDVKNNGTKTNDTQYHSDQITLMIGTQPTCVGYLEAESSVQHNDCCALVSAKVIDDWARDEANFVNGEAIGEDVWYGTDKDGYENKFWDRSFVGLDYEQTPASDVFDSKYCWDFDTNSGETRSTVRRKDFMSKNMNWILFQGRMVAASTVSNDQLFFPNGEPVNWVKDQTNMYLGNNLGTTQNTFNKQGTKAWFKDTYGVDITNGSEDYYDLDAVLACVNQGAYPKTNNMEFIKNLGGRDYVFSDWIVTLAPAKEIGDNEEEEIVLLQSGRVFCEDLGTVDISDIDYNDVVFDAWLYVKRKNNDPSTDVFDKCVIQLLAAGGTIPVQVAGVNVHNAFGVEDDVMVNTFKEGVSNMNSAAKHAEYGVDFDEMPDKIVITNSALLTGVGGTINIKNIPIVVRTSNTAVELTAENSVQGTKAPLKFMAPIGTAWAAERVKIGDAYPYFSNWVQNSTQTPWGTVNSSNTCNIDVVSGTFFSATPTTAWSVPASTTDAEITSAYATITGGKMYVTNGQDSARDLIKSQGGELAFQFTHNNTFFTITLSSPLKAGDVISTRMQSRTDTDLGLWFSTTGRPSSAPTAKIELPAASAEAWTDELTYTVATGDGICGEKAFIIYRATSKSTYFNTFTITRQ